MSGVPLVPGFRGIDIGDGFYYDANAGFNFVLFDVMIEAGVIPEDIPIFGSKGFGLRYIPTVSTEVASDGTASYELNWDNKPLILIPQMYLFH